MERLRQQPVGPEDARLGLHEAARAAVDRTQPVAQRAHRGALRARVERRVDAQAALVDALAAVLALEVLADLLEEVRCDRGRIAVQVQAQRLRLRGVGLLAADVLLRGHPVEHVVAAGERALGVVDRRQPGRVLGHAGDERRLGERQVLHRLAEQEAARRLDPVGAVAEVDLVAVEREDLLLGEVLLDLEGEDHLLDLPLVGLLRGQEQQPGELHRERGEALPAAAGAKVRERGARDAPRVDAEVLPEVLVLDRDDGVAQHGRDVAERHHHPLLDRELADQAAVARQHLRDDVRLEVLERGHLRQVALEGEEDAEQGAPDHGGHEERGHDDAAQCQDARRGRGRRHRSRLWRDERQ